jgi:hypothetical protein
VTAAYTMGAYDELAQRHSYSVVYYVTPYLKPGHQSDLTGSSPASSIAKQYNYLFTGENQDILELDIKFNLAFFNNVTSGTGSAGDGTTATVAKTNGKSKDRGEKASSDPIMINSIESSPAKEALGAATAEDTKKMQGEELKKSIMQDSTGDMVTFDMTIMGDPAWIKQDEILYRTQYGQNGAPIEDPNPLTPRSNSIRQDNGDMFIDLKFKVYDDLDHVTGLRLEASRIADSKMNRNSAFNGHYRVLQIENMFENGLFTQNLVVVRIYVQPTDKDKDKTETINSSQVSVKTLSSLEDQGEDLVDTILTSGNAFVQDIATGITSLLDTDTPSAIDVETITDTTNSQQPGRDNVNL